MTDNLFLIAHRVRSAPAFDIATQVTCAVCEGSLTKVIGLETGEPCDCVDGFWWIIPTSGHRAYPWRWWPLDELRIVDRFGEQDFVQPMDEIQNGIPESWPDHYACNDRPLGLEPEAKIDLRALGLVKPKPPIDRRI